VSCKIAIYDTFHTSCNVYVNNQGTMDTILSYSMQSIVSSIFSQCIFYI
jgi:hypothetical protein